MKSFCLLCLCALNSSIPRCLYAQSGIICFLNVHPCVKKVYIYKGIWLVVFSRPFFPLLLCWTLFVHKKRDREREVTLYCIYNLEYLIWSFEMLQKSNRLVHVVIHLLFTIQFCLKTKCLSVPRQKASPSWKHITLPLIPSLPITRQFAYPPPTSPAPGKRKKKQTKKAKTQKDNLPQFSSGSCHGQFCSSLCSP